MKTVVVYYSGKGSNRYLAAKAAEALGCEAIELIPRFPGVLLATLTTLSCGNKPLKLDFAGLDRVVLCGPLYMGRPASPCKDFIRKYSKVVDKIDFITCCGSTDEKKNETFGYELVFSKLKEQLGVKAGVFEAFPVALLLPEELKNDDQANMNTRMNDDNFNEVVQARLNSFITLIS